jgi:glutamine amidotransferase-like uncharacterized protein
VKNLNSRKDQKRLALIILIIIVSTIPTSIVLINEKINSEKYPTLFGIRVAIYHGNAVLSAANSYVALAHMFRWMGASVDYIEPTEIQNGGLFWYKMLVMPGGSPDSYALELGENGMASIRSFVNFGGTYFGICGGAIFGVSSYLNLYDGNLYYPVPGMGTGAELINMTINQNSRGPNLSKEPEMYTTLYWGSSYFDDYNDWVIPIAFYPQNNRPGMIAFQKGLGTVFLSSPHPEFEEGDDRDGVSSFDTLNDPDSEWDLMLNVSKWLVDISIFNIVFVLFSLVVITIILVSIGRKSKSKRKIRQDL